MGTTPSDTADVADTADPAIVERWLADLQQAIAAADAGAVAALFDADSHWRDVLALTWDLTTVSGADAIGKALLAAARRNHLVGLRTAAGRTAPRQVMRAGVRTLEAIICFETKDGPASGILRLIPPAGAETKPKAWTFATVLDQIRGQEEAGERPRDAGRSLSPGTQPAPAPEQIARFHGPNWLDRRQVAVSYADRDPAVLVVGAGQAGLATAARLNQLGVDTLVVERLPRIGDTWRKRYHSLTLHNQAHVNHFPYLPFPSGWPTYIPKDKLAGWFEAYAEIMEVNAWTGTELEGGVWDGATRTWTVTVRRADGTRRRLKPRHVVMATGVSGIPNIPVIPTLDRFAGPVLHSSQFTDGAACKGKRVLVLGTGTSAHDIAQDLEANGAAVTMVQRSPSMVVNIEPSAQLPYRLYDEGPPLAECDLITTGTPYALLKRSYQLITEEGRGLDKPLLDKLAARGFRLDFGEDGTGWQYMYLTRGGGYYFNIGASDLMIDGRIGLLPHADIAEFTPQGARLRNGELYRADLIVLATGYKGQDQLVARLFGADVAERVGPIWGFGEDQELRNMYRPTRQPGLWFMAGSFAQCRIYSKVLALQIKAREIGLVPAVPPS